MHIGLVSPTDIESSPSWGGISTHTKALFDLLRHLGHRVTLITCSTTNSFPRSYPDNSKVSPLPVAVAAVVNKAFSKAVRDAILQLQEDDPMALVFSEGHSCMGLVGSTAPPSAPPVIAFTHNFSFVHFYNNWQEVHNLRTFLNYVIISLPRIIDRLLTQEWPFFHNCRAIVSVSRFNARLLRTFYRVPPEKLYVIQNWVDCATFRPDTEARANRRRELGIPTNGLVYLLVGSTWRPKGFHVAIEAFGRLTRTGRAAWLVMAGPGTNDEVTLSVAAGFIPALDRVRFLGPVDRADLPSLFNAADVFLIPSLLSEGMPYVPLEAMACGLPVIATDIGGTREVVEGTGLLVPRKNADRLAQAMEDLARDPERRQRLAEASRIRAEMDFSADRAAQSVKDLLARIGNYP